MPPDPTPPAVEPFNPFDLEHQWRAYLERVNIDPAKMGPHQWRETRRAFFGAWGQLTALMHNEIPALEEINAVQAIEAMAYQVAQFWENEARNN